MPPLYLYARVHFFAVRNGTRDLGCGKHPVFPAPSDRQTGKDDANLGQNMPREREVTFIQSSSPRRRGSSIPETAVIEPRSRGVPDPRFRGDDDAMWVAIPASLRRTVWMY